MGWILKIRDTIYRTFGLMIYKKKPFGQDPFEDLKRRFVSYPFRIFFDVGANEGQSAAEIAAVFPMAEIWCFEPVKETFEILKKNTSDANVVCNRLALGAENISRQISVDANNPRSDMYSLAAHETGQSYDLKTEQVAVRTLDDFCASNSIRHIDYLKIDTEGYDLEVLKGALGLLQDQSIAFIETEVSINPENTYHVAFTSVKQFLEGYGYRVFGIYDQMQEWQTNIPVLRRVNALFISEKVYRRE